MPTQQFIRSLESVLQEHGFDAHPFNIRILLSHGLVFIPLDRDLNIILEISINNTLGRPDVMNWVQLHKRTNGNTLKPLIAARIWMTVNALAEYISVVASWTHPHDPYYCQYKK